MLILWSWLSVFSWGGHSGICTFKILALPAGVGGWGSDPWQDFVGEFDFVANGEMLDYLEAIKKLAKSRMDVWRWRLRLTKWVSRTMHNCQCWNYSISICVHAHKTHVEHSLVDFWGTFSTDLYSKEAIVQDHPQPIIILAKLRKGLGAKTWWNLPQNFKWSS